MEAAWGRVAASRPGYAGRPGSRGHVTGVRPPRGRRRLEQGKRVRACGEAGRSWAARLSGPKGGRSAQQRLLLTVLNAHI